MEHQVSNKRINKILAAIKHHIIQNTIKCPNYKSDSKSGMLCFSNIAPRVLTKVVAAHALSANILKLIYALLYAPFSAVTGEQYVLYYHYYY